jgi:hypothetical protein
MVISGLAKGINVEAQPGALESSIVHGDNDIIY